MTAFFSYLCATKDDKISYLFKNVISSKGYIIYKKNTTL